MRKSHRRKEVALGIILAVVSGLILIMGWGYVRVTKAEKAYTPNNLLRLTEEAVPADRESFIRLHLRGNSDEPEDQAAKEKVRDAIMETFGKSLAGLRDSGEAEKALSRALPDIERLAIACLKDNGFSYGAKAAMKKTDFPDRYYEFVDGSTLYLPAGQYNALIVDLGRGEGGNWWCLMYPPLCYLDLVQRAVLLSTASPATKGVPAAIIDEEAAKDVPVEVRSLLLDTLKAGLTRLTDFIAKGREIGLIGPPREYHPTGVVP